MAVGCVCLANDVIFAIVPVALYFYLGGMHWEHIFIPALIFPVISFGLSFFIPESPRYLYAKKMFPELRANLDRIAKVNGVQMPDNYLIDEEVRQEKKRFKLNTKSKQFTRLG